MRYDAIEYGRAVAANPTDCGTISGSFSLYYLMTLASQAARLGSELAVCRCEDLGWEIEMMMRSSQFAATG